MINKKRTSKPKPPASFTLVCTGRIGPCSCKVLRRADAKESPIFHERIPDGQVGDIFRLDDTRGTWFFRNGKTYTLNAEHSTLTRLGKLALPAAPSREKQLLFLIDDICQGDQHAAYAGNTLDAGRKARLEGFREDIFGLDYLAQEFRKTWLRYGTERHPAVIHPTLNANLATQQGLVALTASINGLLNGLRETLPWTDKHGNPDLGPVIDFTPRAVERMLNYSLVKHAIREQGYGERIDIADLDYALGRMGDNFETGFLDDHVDDEGANEPFLSLMKEAQAGVAGVYPQVDAYTLSDFTGPQAQPLLATLAQMIHREVEILNPELSDLTINLDTRLLDQAMRQAVRYENPAPAVHRAASLDEADSPALR